MKISWNCSRVIKLLVCSWFFSVIGLCTVSLGASLVSHPNILKVHHNDCPFQRQLRQRGAQVVALAAAATAVSNAAQCRPSPRHRRSALWAKTSKILFRNISTAEEEISATDKWANLKWVLIYTRDRNVCPGWPVYEVKCLCFRGREWGREESHSH